MRARRRGTLLPVRRLLVMLQALVRSARTWAGLISLAAWLAATGAAQAQTLTIPIGQARSVKLDSPANTAVIGDVEIADARIAFGDTVVLVGKQPGATNLIVYDDSGSEIHNATVNVVSAVDDNVVAVISGSGRTIFDCDSRLCIERREPDTISVSEGEVTEEDEISSTTTTTRF